MTLEELEELREGWEFEAGLVSIKPSSVLKGTSLPASTASLAPIGTSSTHQNDSSVHNKPDLVRNEPSLVRSAQSLVHSDPSLVHRTAPMTEGLDANAKSIIQNVAERRRSPATQVRSAIEALCSNGYLTVAEIAQYLDRSPKVIQRNYIIPMVAEGLLLARYPSTPNHPNQAYMRYTEEESER